MRLIFLTLSLLLHSVAQGQDLFRLTGKILNPQQDYLTFTYYADWVSEPREYTLTLNKDQEFIVEFPLKEIAYCDISFGEHGVHLLKIEPGDSIHLMFDQDDFNNTLRVEGPGSHKWAYQLMLRQRFEVDEDGDRELSQFNSPRYFEITQKWLSLQNQLLDQQTSMVSPEFTALQKADILGKVKLFELGYLNNKNSSDSLLQLDWNQFPEHIKAKSIYMGQVADALVDNYLKNKRTSASRTLEYEYLKLLKDRIGTGLTEKVLATKLLQYLDTDGMSEEIKLLGEDFMYFAQNDEYKKVLATQFRRKEALAVGKTAPNFIVQNKKGKLVELKDFKGKNLVLSFYDDECYLCHEDMRAMEFVHGFFRKKKDLLFVFINLSPRELYLQFIKNPSLLGTHLNAPDNSFIRKNYNTQLLPNYLIIDKTGKILANVVDEPRLDDGRSMIQDIEKLIYKP
jgi:peroxiredoxin